MATRRELIIEFLKSEEWTARELQLHFGCTSKEIIGDLTHVKKSVMPKHRLLRNHAVCRDCGFEFKERAKLKTPSKCPKCRSEAIVEPTFRIV